MTLDQHYTAVYVAAYLEADDADWLANEQRLEEWVRTGEDPDTDSQDEGRDDTL